MRTYLMFFLMGFMAFSFCPKRKHPYEKAIIKIMGKTWFQYKVCGADTCLPPDDSLFFTGTFDDFKNHFKGFNGEPLTCITPHVVTPYYGNGKRMFANCFDCIPLICFIDTLNSGSIFPINLMSLGGMRGGTLSFISDSEFVIEEQVNWRRKIRIYYRLVKNIK